MPIPIATGLIAGVVYLLTLSQDLTWANFGSDGGELVTASVTLGVPHPPGYPTYVLVGKLFGFLPFGDTLAYRYNLFSAVAMSSAVGLLTATCGKMFNHIDPAKSKNKLSFLSIGLTFAFIPLVWSQSVIAEVYALNLSVLAALLWFLLGPAERQRPLVIVFLLGLATTTHLTSLFLLPAVFLLLCKLSWKRVLSGFLLGVSPFLAPLLLGSGNSPIIWGDPTDLSGLWWLVSAELYQPNIGHWILSIFDSRQVLLASFLITSIAVGILWRRYRPIHKDIVVTLYEPVLLISAGCYFVFASFYQTNDADVMALPGILLLLLAMTRLLQKFGPVTLILPMMLLGLHLSTGAKIDDTSPRIMGESIINSAPSGAILVSGNEQELFTLWYLQHAEGQREDLITINSDIFQFDWFRHRLREAHPSLRQLQSDDIDAFIGENKRLRPICNVSFSEPEPIQCLPVTDY
jgi:hypothetical protein